MTKKHAVLPEKKPAVSRPHKCDATLINIDKVITEVERFNRKIRESQARWDRG